MITREQFGPYLLLKKLAEDPLGETFRAGRLGRQGMERVVLLRVLNGSAVEGLDLWSRVSNRGAVQQALRSPNIGSGVDLGQVQGVPYVAYDYISGKNLGSVFEQVTKSSQPVPIEHALLISERLALGLAVAYETRVAAERILHGFLVPQLILVSNEGENRLLGFEVAPGLRGLVPTSPLREAFGRYLSPETLAGAPPAKTDDVYSLGAILLELLLGRQLPEHDGESAALVKEVAQRGPAPVVSLIERSLAPPSDRIGDVVTWHKGLSKILIEGQYSATTFNLAFFMHNLFRDEIEKESQEIEIERTIEIPAARPPAPATEPATPSAPTAVEEAAPAVSEPAPVTAVEATEPSADEPAGKWRLLVPVAALVVVGLGIGGWFGWQYLPPGLLGGAPSGAGAEPAPTNALAAGPSERPLPPVTEPASDLEPADAETEGATGEGPTPEELRQQIDEIVAERTDTMERTLRSQYDDEIAALRSQLEAAKRAQDRAEQERFRAQAQLDASEQALPAASTGASGAPAVGAGRRPAARTPASSSPGETDRIASATSTPDRTVEPPVERQLPGTAPPPPSTTPPATEGKPSLGQPAEPVKEAEPAPPPPPPPPPPRQPPPKRVRRGDLVPLAPDVVPPKLSSRLEPRYPPMARKMKREAVVLVAVLVDDNGRVEDVKLRDPKAGYGFDEAAIQAARRARFKPATKNGVLVKVWTTIKIEFRLE